MTLGLVDSAWASEAVSLKKGPNQGKVIQNCMTCHSLDYIQMHDGLLDRKGWEAEVTKMIRVYGAPVPEKDAPLIVDYLTENYGRKP
jgi:hypothetical protein